MATCNVNTLLSDGKDFQRCSDFDLSACIAQLLCDISAGSSGSTSITIGAGPPVAAPVGSNGFYVDSNTGILYVYYNAAWH